MDSTLNMRSRALQIRVVPIIISASAISADVPDSLYKSMAAIYKSKIHTYLKGGGHVFIYEWISITNRI